MNANKTGGRYIVE